MTEQTGTASSSASYRWGRLKTSQWHVVHSVRYDGDSEFILTVDGERLPTERVKWNYAVVTGRAKGHPESTGAKLIEGHRPPSRSRVCSRCLSYVIALEKTTEVG